MAEKKKSSILIALIAGIIILAGVVIFMTSLFGSTSKEPEAIIETDSVEITGQYGKTYNFADINEISLTYTIPAIGAKKNGAGLGDIKKGDFEVEGMGLTRLFIMSAQGPYIVMDTSNGFVIISFSDPEKTQSLYEELKAAVI